MAPLKIMGRLDLASDYTTAVDFSTKLPSSPAGGLTRTWAPAKVAQVADDCGPTLTKAELAELLFAHVGLNKREAKDMVEAFFVEISDALERGDSVKLTGFGNFRLRDKISRPGRNPKTGVVVNIPARRVVTFHASPKLKTATDEPAAISGMPEYVNAKVRA